jgi:CubicO group peptidase (beta-lactamase class C family)
MSRFGSGAALAVLVGRVVISAALLGGAGCADQKPPAAAPAVAGNPADLLQAHIIARGESLSLHPKWTPPPGVAIEHSTAGFANTLCSAVFITGLDPADAAANVGFFTGPLEDRKAVTDTVIDRKTQTVRLTLASGVTRVARRYGSQGCIALPKDRDSVFFTPTVVKPILPPAASTPWPMGDVITGPWPAEVDSIKMKAAMDVGFGPPEGMTLALLVTYRGRIVGERYAPGIGIHTPLESWSMGKSITGTLMGILLKRGAYQLEQPAPIPEWRQPDDPRQAIRIIDLMRMSSGLMLRGPFDPDYDSTKGYPDHVYLYTGTVNSFQYAATRPQEWKPNTVGRYRNTDPVLANYLIRLAVEKAGEDYHAFPQRSLFDKIGIRDAVIETDPYGDFLTQGYDFLPARDWARLANLYLQDGVWNGERILPEGYVSHVKTIAPAWAADGDPVYGGGFFWVNGDGALPLPKDAFAMQGAGGQSVRIIPSHGLVVVRIGKYRGATPGTAALVQAYPLFLAAVTAR